MQNTTYKSPDTPPKKSNMPLFAGLVLATTIVGAAMVSRPDEGLKPAPLPTTSEDTPEVRAACSSGHARVYYDRDVVLRGRQMTAKCSDYWTPRGMDMP